MRDAQRNPRPQQHRQRNREANQHCAGHRRADQPDHQLGIGQGRHQVIDDRPLDLAGKEIEAGIGEGIGDHPHHDQPRGDKAGERHAKHFASAPPHCDGEDHQIKQA